MRISKVYTRTGDDGSTGLVNGQRVSKSSLRIQAMGEVDELNSLLGVVRSRVADGFIQPLLGEIQNHLFVLGADLATPLPRGSEPPIPIRRITEAEIESLEQAVDRCNQQLPPLREFILPGGSEPAALLHLARAVARRAERAAAALAEAESISPFAAIYLNRLSDLLFVLARIANRQSGSAETFAEYH